MKKKAKFVVGKKCIQGLARIMNTKYWICNACKKKFSDLRDAQIHFGITPNTGEYDPNLRKY